MIITCITSWLIAIIGYGASLGSFYSTFFKQENLSESLGYKWSLTIINFIFKILPFLDYRKIKNKILRKISGLILSIPWMVGGTLLGYIKK